MNYNTPLNFEKFQKTQFNSKFDDSATIGFLSSMFTNGQIKKRGIDLALYQSDLPRDLYTSPNERKFLHTG